MNLNDFFGPSAVPRPEHADFWRLIEIVQGLDIQMDAAVGDEKHDVYERILDAQADRDSVTYLAFQRAIRALGLDTRDKLRQQVPLVMLMTTLYMEGFIVGAMFKEPFKSPPREAEGYDVQALYALARGNVDEGTNPLDLDEDVHDVASRQASGVNNSGVDGQIDFLVEHLGFFAAQTLVHDRNREQR